jgi:hypothetical protein
VATRAAKRAGCDEKAIWNDEADLTSRREAKSLSRNNNRLDRGGDIRHAHVTTSCYGPIRPILSALFTLREGLTAARGALLAVI